MIYYLLLLLSVVLPMICKDKRLYCILIFTFMTLVSGFRGDGVGTDTHMYNDYASWYPNTTWEEFFFSDTGRKAIEIGVFFLMKIATAFGNTQAFIFISSVVTFSLLGWFIYKNIDSRYCWISVFVVVTFGFFFYSMNVLRQALAIALSLHVYSFYMRDEYIKCFFVLILTALFHYSVLIVIPIFIIIIAYKKIKKDSNPVLASLNVSFIVMGIIIVSYFILINNLEFIDTTYIMYFSASGGYAFEGSAGGYSYVIAIFTILMILLSGLLMSDEKKRKAFYFCDVMLLTSLIFMLAQMNVMAIFYRFIDTFSIYFCVLIPELLCTIKNDANKIMFSGLIVIFGVLNMTYILMKGLHQVTEYSVFF